MRKLFCFLFVGLTTSLFAQTEEFHAGKVIGSFSLNSQDVTTIYDEESNCIRKTSPHTEDLFVANESVQIKITDNQELSEILKTGLTEHVYANKFCNEEPQSNCSEPLCIIENENNYLLIQYSWNDYLVFYHATGDADNYINSSLIIIKGNYSISTVYALDKSDGDKYKLSSYIGVLSEANKLLNLSGIQLGDEEVILLEDLILDMKTQLQTINEPELARSLFYHVSIIKSAKRGLENNSSDCKCATAPLYFKDGNPFICQEDLFYDINAALDGITDHYSEISQSYDPATIDELEVYLESKSQSSSTISFEEINVELGNGLAANTFNDQLDEVVNAAPCPLGLGSALGCCGNYAGCCWYWSTTCLLHDLACLTCSHWYCGWACVSL